MVLEIMFNNYCMKFEQPLVYVEKFATNESGEMEIRALFFFKNCDQANSVFT